MACRHALFAADDRKEL